MSKVDLLCHNSIKISGGKIIYIDPYKIKEEKNDADYIFCTHTHYDHFSPEDINKIKKDSTKIIIVKDGKEEAQKLIKEENILLVEPNNKYEIDGIKFSTTYAYNVNKKFHPKENMWTGYIIEFEGIKYYIAGDTDNIPEIQNIKCDIAFIPVGGTYTMDYIEAAELANTIEAKVVIPTHYGLIVGDKEDGENFKKLVENREVKVLI